MTTFNFTGGTQTFVVPPDVELLVVECWGASGGHEGILPIPMGGYVRALLAVTPGETLNIEVGGAAGASPTPGYNGGGSGGFASGGNAYGGGGATDVRRGSGLADRLVVAGGGGGHGPAVSVGPHGGAGGYPTGGDGASLYAGQYGHGGTQSAGGATGTPSSDGLTGTPGTLGHGGVGWSYNGLRFPGGGGGGGLYGGGGSSEGGGGGGGSSGVPGGTLTADATGVRNGNGLCIVNIGGGWRQDASRW